MAIEQSLATTVGEVIESVVNKAETIHRKIAEVPIDVLEVVAEVEEPLKGIRRIQDQVIGSIYDLVRRVNREVTQSASELLEGTDHHRRVDDGASVATH